MNSPVIVWFRLDLRIEDNPALLAARKSGNPVIPVFIWSPDEEGNWQPGSASRVWLYHALKSLQSDLQALDCGLLLLNGPCHYALEQLISKTGATQVFWNRCYEPCAIGRDSRIKEKLQKSGIKVRSFNANLLFEPHEIRNKQDKPYKVFTPFWRQYQALEIEKPLKSDRGRLPAVNTRVDSASLEEFGLLPKIKWHTGIMENWDMSAHAGGEQVRKFISRSLQDYIKCRDIPSLDKVSLISPYLHFGQVSARQIWHMVLQDEQQDGRITPAGTSEGYLRQLVWREFAYHLLFHFPHSTDKPLFERYAGFPWARSAKKQLACWQRGETGYPIVDAGMRQLWHSGWMHNRVRMITGSFLTKDLLVHWKKGAEWFWDTLVDADLANNTMGWQWVAGCGADAAPYFRIFNPVTQGERFDPDGAYVRKWIPELKGLEDRYIHQPWNAPGKLLSNAGIRLGKTYPEPLVNHAEARRRALDTYSSFKQGM